MNKRRIATLVAALVVVLAVLGGILFLRPSTGTNVVVAENSPTPSATPVAATPVPTPTPYPTAPPVQCAAWSQVPMTSNDAFHSSNLMYNYMRGLIAHYYLDDPKLRGTDKDANLLASQDPDPHKRVISMDEWNATGWNDNGRQGTKSVYDILQPMSFHILQPQEYHGDAVTLRSQFFNTAAAVDMFPEIPCRLAEMIARTPSS